MNKLRPPGAAREFLFTHVARVLCPGSAMVNMLELLHALLGPPSALPVQGASS